MSDTGDTGAAGTSSAGTGGTGGCRGWYTTVQPGPNNSMQKHVASSFIMRPGAVACAAPMQPRARHDAAEASVPSSMPFGARNHTAHPALNKGHAGRVRVSIFSSIMSKIFHHPSASPAGTESGTAAVTGALPADDTAVLSGASAAAVAASAPTTPVDVGAVLGQMASAKGGGGNYQTSIVDLLKLLDLDSSLDARKELGQELGVHAGADGSAEQNVALMKAVVAKLAENGGKVPDSMKA